jgi:hypothetical protein
MMEAMRRPFFMTFLIGVCSSLALGQSLPVPGADLLKFSTNVGSLKILNQGPTNPNGHLEMSFTGTILVSGNPKMVLTGNVKKEYEDKPHHKSVFSGTGKIVIDGEFENLQWFGKNLTGSFKGHGYIRLYGDYDANLKTGTYTFGDNLKTGDWGTNGTSLNIPIAANLMKTSKPTVKQE